MLQLKALSEDDLAHYWRLYVDKLADLLAEADARPHGPAPDLARRVQSLQREALFLHIRQDPCACYILHIELHSIYSCAWSSLTPMHVKIAQHVVFHGAYVVCWGMAGARERGVSARRT